MRRKPFRKNFFIKTLTPERIAAALRRTDGNIPLVAKAMGCSPYSVKYRVMKDPALLALLEQLRNK